MVVGPIDNCLTTPAPGNNDQHMHTAHLIIQDVEDLIGWQARLNYDGGIFRPAAVNFTPYPDNIRGQNVSFTNLPLDPATGVHREILPVSDIPASAPGPQTALIAAAYLGDQTAASSPDTPPKSPPDDTSYSAPNGGILATINLQVLPGRAGQGLMAIDLDDANPNSPGSRVVVFDGSASRDITLEDGVLYDGFHAEGAACVPPPGVATPPPAGGPGAPGGQGVPGQPGVSPGTSPGTSPGASPGASPTVGAGAPGGTSPSGTSTPRGEDTDGNGEGDGGEGDGGSSVWIYVLAVLALLALLAGLAAWRFRSRLPWLQRLPWFRR